MWPDQSHLPRLLAAQASDDLATCSHPADVAQELGPLEEHCTYSVFRIVKIRRSVSGITLPLSPTQKQTFRKTPLEGGSGARVGATARSPNSDSRDKKRLTPISTFSKFPLGEGTRFNRFQGFELHPKHIKHQQDRGQHQAPLKRAANAQI